jgi:hypothetical protein
LNNPSTKFLFHKNPGWTPSWDSLLSYDGGEGSLRVGLSYMGRGMAKGERGGVVLSAASMNMVWISLEMGFKVGE